MIVFGDNASENFSTHEAHIFRAIYEHELSDNLNGRFSVSHSSHDKLIKISMLLIHGKQAALPVDMIQILTLLP